jgi:Siphovirus protein of unknown function (DUF859)
MVVVLNSSYQKIMSTVNGNYTHRYYAKLNSQNIPSNESSVAYKATIQNNGSGTAFNTAISTNFNAKTNGVSDTETHSFDFRGNTSEVTFVSGNVTIVHNPDGTKTGVACSFDMPTADFTTGFQETTGSGTFNLPAIPRGPKVKVTGQFKQAICFVKVGGLWKTAIPYIKVDGIWKTMS